MTSILSMLKRRKTLFMLVGFAVIGGFTGIYAVAKTSGNEPAAGVSAPKSAATGRAVLTVVLTSPQLVEWPRIITANGNIAAWQEAVIGSEISGYPITELRVGVGDVVKKGDLLANISSDMLAAELEQSKAALLEVEATLAEARLNADRARKIEPAGAMSAQQINQYLTAESTASARLNAAKAKLKFDQLRLAQTRILAPDNGLIAARAATLGSLTQPGQELFRLIRNNRLEWRAEVSSSELGRIKSGLKVVLTTPNGTRIQGKVRTVAPTVDVQTRNAIVYVDLPNDNAARAGMFARGEFELGAGTVLALPLSAVLMRDGFSYVYRVDSNHRVVQMKVTLGRRLGDRVEIARGLEVGTRVVATGAAFLVDGDVVRVVDSK